jgi:hypothetical protein
MAPVVIIFAVVLYLQKKSALTSVVCVVIGLFFIGVFCVSFVYAKRHIAPLSVIVEEISPADGWIWGFIASYLFPLTSIAITDFNLLITLIIALAVMSVLPWVNAASPHPILFLVGYHFYSVGTANGVKDYLLISRRKLRNKNQIQSVKRLFEYLLLDEQR